LGCSTRSSSRGGTPGSMADISRRRAQSTTMRPKDIYKQGGFGQHRTLRWMGYPMADQVRTFLCRDRSWRRRLVLDSRRLFFRPPRPAPARRRVQKWRSFYFRVRRLPIRPCRRSTTSSSSRQAQEHPREWMGEPAFSTAKRDRAPAPHFAMEGRLRAPTEQHEDWVALAQLSRIGQSRWSAIQCRPGRGTESAQRSRFECAMNVP